MGEDFTNKDTVILSESELVGLLGSIEYAQEKLLTDTSLPPEIHTLITGILHDCKNTLDGIVTI